MYLNTGLGAANPRLNPRSMAPRLLPVPRFFRRPGGGLGIVVPPSANNPAGGDYRGVADYLAYTNSGETAAACASPSLDGMKRAAASQCAYLGVYDPACADNGVAAAQAQYDALLAQCRANAFPVGGGGTAPPPSTVSGAGTPSGYTSPASSTPATASLTNTSRPGYAFQVGDSFQLVISGTPGQPVSVTATQNGRSLGTTVYGTTDPSGRLTITGTMDPSTVGNWNELWMVGAAGVPALSFSVSPAQNSQSSPPPASSAGASSASSTPPPTGQTTPGAGSSSSSSGGGSSTSTTQTAGGSSTVDVFGYSVPWWAAGLVVVGAVWMFSSSTSGGGRRG